MPNNLFALVGDRNQLDVRRVQVSAEIQQQLAGLFFSFKSHFLDGIDEEIEFTHSWKADEDELFYISDNDQAEELSDLLIAGALDFEAIDPENFEHENVKALVFSPDDDGDFLVQYFYASQHLSRRGFTLFFDGDTFTKFEEPGFSIGQKIDLVFENGRLKFKNFNIAKRVFDVLGNYTEASDGQVDQFANMDVVQIDDLDEFKAILNQTTRKLISAIASEGTLDDVAVDEIVVSADGLGLAIEVENGRIVFPTDKQRLKHLLRFLDHGVYNSPLIADRRFIANSKMQY